MRVIASDIKLSSRHEAQQQIEVETHVTRTFAAVMAEQAATQQDAEASKTKLARMLKNLLETILAALEGKKYHAESAGESTQTAVSQATNERQREVKWVMEASTRISESESTQVEGSGQIRTADGRCIDFSMCVAMQRQFVSEEKISESGNYVLHDPLVLNYAGKAAELTAQRIDFDLDVDGGNEKIAVLAAGSGYLVLDRNDNGRVDDGSELFGTKSGNGFTDLKTLDADGNGWLDEADPTFAKLQLWGGERQDRDYRSLASAGVGAIWLGSVESPFALKDPANRLLGEIRATGLWLAEDGHVGSLQQVDLAVADEDAKGRLAEAKTQSA